MTDPTMDHIARAERIARVERRRINPWQCTSCRYASYAATTDPDGLCPWCRAEAAKADHLNSVLALIEGGSR